MRPGVCVIHASTLQARLVAATKHWFARFCFTVSTTRKRARCTTSTSTFPDSARALIRNGINPDDRTAVGSALSDSAGYTHDPAVFARYVDEVIKTARHNMATGQTD
jgi:hypothetical protein